MWGALFRWPTVLLVFTLALSACEDADDRAISHFDKGQEFVETGELTKATLEFRNALQINDGFGEARYAFAQVLIQQENFRSAFDQLRLLVDKEPDHFAARLRLAELMLIGGTIEDAEAMVMQALGLQPMDAQATALAAMIKYRLGKVPEALKLADAALAMSPPPVTARLVKIAERVDMGDALGGLALTDKYLATAPDDGALNLVRLNILLQTGQREEAEAQLRHLLKTYPDNQSFAISLARSRFQKGDVVEAEALLRAFAARHSEDAQAGLAVVQFLREANGEEAARAELDRLTRASPDEVEYIIALSAMEFRNGEVASAVARLEAAISDANTDNLARTRARTALASMLMISGNAEGAARVLDEALKADAEDATALSLRGRIRIDQNDMEGALTDLRAALAQRPNSAEVLMMLATVNARLGNSGIAEDRLAAAARYSNYAPEPVRRYVALLVANKRHDAAELVLNEALSANGQRTDLLASLGQVRLLQGNWTGARRAGEELRRLIETPEQEVAVDRILALALAGEGKSSESMALLETAWTESGGQDRFALNTLIDAYIGSGEVNRAATFLDKVLAEQPRNIDALIQRGRTFLAQNDITSAEAILANAVEVAPDDVDARLALLQVLIGTEQTERAIDVARTGIERSEEPAPSLRLLLAMQLAESGQRAEAVAGYENLHADFPASKLVANNLASLLAAGNPDKAEIERAYSIARTLRNEAEPAFRETYGWLLFLRGDVAESIAVLESTSVALGDNPDAQFHLGLVYEKAGRIIDAKRQFETVLRLEDEGADFKRRADLEAALGRLPSQ